MALPYEYTPNIWPLLASVLFLSVMGFYAYRDRTVPGAVPFLIMVTVLLLWVMSNALELAGTHDKIRIFWFKFEKALLLLAISAELCFALEYAGLDKWVTRRTVFALAIPPFIFLLLILANDTYHLVWTHIWSDGIIHAVRGPASWGAVFYAYFLSLLNLTVLVWLFARSPRHRWVAVGLIIALFITRGSFFFKIASWNPVAPLEPMMVAANFALLPYALAVYRFRMFDVVPVARHTVIEKMSDGIMVLDPENCIVDVNEAAQKILGVIRSKVIGRNVTKILHAFPELLGLVHDSDETQCEVLTGDTKPNYYLVDQATNGVDVLIHEIASPPEVWVYEFTGLTPDDGAAYTQVYDDLKNVQDSSHTEQKMFGYILSLLDKPPRLAVGTHFAATDDVIRYALKDIRSYYPEGEITVATDFMVINVTKKAIRQRRAVVSDFVWQPPLDPAIVYGKFDPPKYWKYYVDENGKTTKVGDPYAQLDPNANVIPYPNDYGEW